MFFLLNKIKMDSKNFVGNEDINLEFCLEDEIDIFNLNPTRFIKMKPFTLNETPLVVLLKGKLTQENVSFATLGGNSCYSLGMKFEDDSYQQLFNELSEKIDVVVPEWPVNNPSSGKIFFLRLGFNQIQNKFTTKSNLVLKPSTIENLSIKKDQDIQATVELKAWFDMKGKKAGVSLKVNYVKFL